jgi:cytochrome c peroxidase
MRGAAWTGACLVLVTCRPPAPFGVRVPTGLDLFAPVPDGSPVTRGRVALGERLFDSQLSADRRVSCSSCHTPAHAFSDTVSRSSGTHGRTGLRNAPSLLNAAYRPRLFWDGRATTLEAQVLQPIRDSLEMNLPIAALEARLQASRSYRRAFRREFGEIPTAPDVARALAAFLRSLRSGGSPVDRFNAGAAAALSPDADRGAELFAGRAHCSRCHIGPLFSDEAFHNTGIAWRRGTFQDFGRMAVTGDSADVGRFRTPSLRNVARTAPYMHDGSLATLDAVIDFYDAGGRRNPNLDPLLDPLGLSRAEKLHLRAFLEALTSEH